MKRRVVVSGLGLITPCGEGWQPFWTAALSGKSSIGTLSQFSLNGFASRFAGEILNHEVTSLFKNRKSLKVMSKPIKLAITASYLALTDAALDIKQVDADRFGISFGTGIINNDLDEIGQGIREAISDGGFDIKKFGQNGIRALFPLWFLKYLPNMPACHISIAHGLKGPNNTITTSCAAGAEAIGEAFKVIQRGDADLMLAGSTDSKLNPMGIARLQLLGLLSRENHSPQNAYRPFDEGHSGMILGEGSGILVLEELSHAVKRGAKIYAEVTGYGSSSDHIFEQPYPEDFTGQSRAMMRALHDAKVTPDQIDVLIANASGIPHQDVQEASAVREIFKNVSRLKVTGLKPITGHLFYGSGGVECAGAVLCVKEKKVPPLAHFEKPAPRCELPIVAGKASPAAVKSLLFNSFGFGGQNASLVLRSYE